MKRFILLHTLFFCFSMVAQITNEKPNNYGIELKSNVPTVVMPEFDLQKLQKEDAINDRDRTKVFRFGYEHKVNLAIQNSGVWQELADGGGVWRINIVSEGAQTLNFLFTEYRLPDGATLHLYNPDKSFMLGAYTSLMNNEQNMLGTWLADGENITLEYYVPSLKNKGKLTIGSVIHGYRSISNIKAQQKALNESGNCNQDVNCPVGNDFDDTKDVLKKAVAMMLVGGEGVCTGTLINNTSNNKAPYLLTAFHCRDLEALWAFRFNWISENTVCSGSEDSTDNGSDNYYQTTSGSVRLARSEESDVRLIEITGGLDPNWNLTWAGWDRTGNIPDFTVGIHHPSGDIMKVCRDNQNASKRRVTIDGQNSAVWETSNWDIGVTEGGSSGSALFDQNGRIIGQLFGGAAGCVGNTDNNAPDFYGRFKVSWDFGTTDATRLSNWLDPIGTGVQVLDLIEQEPNLNVGENEFDNEIVVYPNPASSIISIKNTLNRRLEYQLMEINGKVIKSGVLDFTQKSIDISGQNNGIYFLYLTNNGSGTQLTKKIIIEK